MNFNNLSVLGKYSLKTGNNLLIFHLIDTAAVSLELWNRTCPISIKERITNYLYYLFHLDHENLDDELSKDCLGFFVALHDLGKISPPFQKRVKSSGAVQNEWELVPLYNTLFSEERNLVSNISSHHSAITYQAIQEFLDYKPINTLDIRELDHKKIALILSAHHGKYHKSEVLVQLIRHRRTQMGEDIWLQTRRSHVKVLSHLFFPLKISQTSSKAEKEDYYVPEITWLVGLTCIADWIASSKDFFPYSTQLPRKWDDVENYWRMARERAKDVIDQLNWKISRTKVDSDKRNFKDIFNKVPRPLQQQLEEIEISQPECFIIEAPTGEGKTEAALYLMIKNDMIGLSGAYIALPTQATSNQMFSRMKSFLSKYYISVDDKFNLMLLHGHATLVKEFEELLEFSPININETEVNEATPQVNKWFTYRKRSILTPYGVGTIDQALMSVLQTKHYMVRLYGLAGKTVILDEVHAYDIFMTEIIEKMLTWLAALGSSVIMLSATLPSARRIQLIKAFQKGKKIWTQNTQELSTVITEVQANYPRITWTNKLSIEETEFLPSEVGMKEVKLSWISKNYIQEELELIEDFVRGEVYKSELKDVIETKLKNGGCGAIICNRVDEAQEIFNRLSVLNEKNKEYKIILFHSRFRILERNEIERKIITYFGEDRVKRPKKAIVIATQVIEQSLDIDFDLMISAIAPIDLILQRIGRLHRHKTETRIIKSPEFIVMLTSLNNEIQSSPIPNFKIYNRIYHSHVILRTWLWMKDFILLKIPDIIESAIEYVYNEDLESKIKLDADLEQYWNNSKDKMLEGSTKIKKMAQNQLLRDPDGSVPLYKIGENELEEDDPTIHEFRRAQTRLMGPSLGVVLLKKNELDYYETQVDKIRSTKFQTIPKLLKKWLLERSVNLTNYVAIKNLRNYNTPEEWVNDSHLKYYKLLALESQNSEDLVVVNEILKIVLNPELGIIIQKIT